MTEEAEQGTNPQTQQDPPTTSAPPVADDDGSSECQFSRAFYDMKTDMIMMNPVVDRNGDSCEKPSVDDKTSDYYPNRALQSIIQRETKLKCKSVLGTIRRLDDSARKGWNKMLEKSVMGMNMDVRPLPDSFYCIITSELMRDPVITPSGNSFDREAIVNWIRANSTDPVTRMALKVTQLRRNNNLYNLIQEEKTRPGPGNRHPSIIRWVQQGDIETSRGALSPEDLADNMPVTAQPPTTPVTYQQMAAARRRHQRAAHINQTLSILFFFTVAVIFFFVPAMFVFFALFLALLMLTCCCCAADQHAPQG